MDNAAESLIIQCGHKNWKERVIAYEKLTDLLQKSDSDDESVGSKLNAIVTQITKDPNVIAREKGLNLVLGLVESRTLVGRTVTETLTGLVQHCVSTSRPKTKELSVQILVGLVRAQHQERVVDALLATNGKSPKITAASVQCLTQILNEFGPKNLDMTKVLEKVESYLGDRDGQVRSEAKLFLVELYRWWGSSLVPRLKVSDIHRKELESEFAAVKTMKSSKENLPEPSDPAPEGNLTYNIDSPCAEIEEAEPVDILSKLPNQFYKRIEHKKWTERKEALDALEALLASAPKVVHSDYTQLCTSLQKLAMKDSNVVVSMAALRCIAALGKSAKGKLQVSSQLFDKFRDKKAIVTGAVRDVVDAVFGPASLDNILDDLVSYLKSKNPNIRAETAGYLERCFCRGKPLGKKVMKGLLPELAKLVSDQDPCVRENAIGALSNSMSLLGSKTVLPYLSDLDTGKLAKITDRCTNVLVPDQKNGAAVETLTSLVKRASSSDEKTKRSAFLGLQKRYDINASDEVIEACLTAVLTTSLSESDSTVLDVKLHLIHEITTAVGISEKYLNSVVEHVVSAMVHRPDAAKGALLALIQSQTFDIIVRRILSNNYIRTQKTAWCQALCFISESLLERKVENPDFLIAIGRQTLEQSDPALKHAGLALIGSVHLRYNTGAPKPVHRPLFRVNDLKRRRHPNHPVKSGWIRDQMKNAEFAPNLTSDMFSSDFKANLNAVKTLSDNLDDVQGLASNFDLVLYWITVKIGEETPIATTLLEYTISALQRLSCVSYSISDSELHLIPFIIEKIGPKGEKLFNELFVAIRKLSSANTLFKYFIDELQNHKLCCLSALRGLVEDGGDFPLISVKLVLHQVNHHDVAVRDAAFKLIVSLYKKIGDKVFEDAEEILGKEFDFTERIRQAAGYPGNNTVVDFDQVLSRIQRQIEAKTSLDSARTDLKLLLKWCSQHAFWKDVSERVVHRLILVSLQVPLYGGEDRTVACCKSLTTQAIEKGDKTHVLCALIDTLRSSNLSVSQLSAKYLWKFLQREPKLNVDCSKIVPKVQPLFDVPLSPTLLGPVKSLLRALVKSNSDEMFRLATPESNLHSYLKSLTVHREPNLSSHLMKELSDIFALIGTGTKTNTGLTKLYEFKIAHPEIDLSRILSRTSVKFQDYIQNNFDGMERTLEPFGRDIEALMRRLHIFQEKAGLTNL